MTHFIEMIKWPDKPHVTYAAVQEVDVVGTIDNRPVPVIVQAALIAHTQGIGERLKVMPPVCDSAFIVTEVKGRLVVVDAMQRDVGERWTYLITHDELPCSQREFMAFLTGKVEWLVRMDYTAPNQPWAGGQ
jgi:hypothetical protein